ncbi:hypothetical protein Trydic_g12821 [Trypoxylus dichotomus]
MGAPFPWPSALEEERTVKHLSLSSTRVAIGKSEVPALLEECRDPKTDPTPPIGRWDQDEVGGAIMG